MDLRMGAIEEVLRQNPHVLTLLEKSVTRERVALFRTIQTMLIQHGEDEAHEVRKKIFVEGA